MAQTNKSPRTAHPTRRDFLKTSALAAGAALGSAPFVNLHAQDTSRKFKAALIGCGGRGNGAANDHLEAVKYLNEKLGWNLQVEFVASGDWFKGRAEGAGQRYGVPKERCFGGGDCYKKVLEAGPDVVLMAQPPAFRPRHFEAVIQAGKHVFFEKPSAVDPPGVRRVIQAGEAAKQKGLCVAAGTQRRHEKGYNDQAREIKDGNTPRSKDPYEEVGYSPKGAYVSEHAHLLYAIVKGQPLNEAYNVATSTGTAILARESAYSGKRITWAEMFEDPNGKFYKLQLKPTAEDFETGEIVLLKDGDIRIPGLPA